MSAEANKLIELIKEEMAAILACSPEEIDENENFLSMGVSSIQAVKIINKLKNKLGIDISPAVIFEYQTIQELVAYLLEEKNA